MRTFISIACLLLLGQLYAQKIQGDWYGTLDAMGTKIPLVFHIIGSDDQLKGTMDSPEQQAYGIEMSDLFFANGQFSARIPMIQASFKGTLSKLGLSGDFTQAGFDFPMSFSNVAPTATGRQLREQDPKDFPYERLSVEFPSDNGNISIAGELTYPSKDQEVDRVVVLISGSGGQDRNAELGKAINHRPFLVLSDFLTKSGIAVLRCDDRGIGQSTGDFSAATTMDFAGDISAAVDFLKAHPVTKSAKVGLIGHSEGGLIAPIVATKNEAVDFLVLLAGPGVPSDTLMMEQSRMIQRSMGAPPQLIERNLRPVRKAYEIIKQHPELSQDTLQEKLLKVFKDDIVNLPVPLQKSIKDKDAFARQQIGSLSSDWFRYFISFDPKPYLEQVKIPVIALNGELDLQVPAEINLNAIANAVGSNGNPQITIVSLPQLNHLFQTATTGAPQEYGEIEETFNTGAMRIIVTWIKQQ